MFCKHSNRAALHLRIALYCGAAAVLGCMGSVYAATSELPAGTSRLIMTVRQMMESLTSPVSFKMNKDEADRYWDKKKECVRSVERSTDEKYPWCDDPDYAVLQHRPIADMSDVQYDLYRTLHNRCADAAEDEGGRRIDEC